MTLFYRLEIILMLDIKPIEEKDIDMASYIITVRNLVQIRTMIHLSLSGPNIITNCR